MSGTNPAKRSRLQIVPVPDELAQWDRDGGCLYSGTFGDAMGALPEGKDPAEIKARYGEPRDFRGTAPPAWARGNGRHTDDTRMIRVLSYIY